MGAAVTRKKVQRKFKLRGFTLKVEALEEALAFLSRFPDAEDDALDLLIDEIDKESLKSSILEREAIHRVVSLLLDADAAVDPSSAVASSRVALRVIDAFVVPRFRYDPIKKVFYEHTGRLPIHGEAGDKAALYRDRYQLLLQRLSRDKYFSRPAFDTQMTDSESCEVSWGAFENTAFVLPRSTDRFHLLLDVLNCIDGFVDAFEEDAWIIGFSLLVLLDVDNSNPIFDWMHWKEMDHGGDITVRRRPFLLGRSYCSSTN